MKLSTRVFFLLVLALSLILAACTASPVVKTLPEDASLFPVTETIEPTESSNLPTEPATQPPVDPPTKANQEPTDTTPLKSELNSDIETENWTREDAQGQVSVVVSPLNLGQQTKTLDFEIAMDTHSVDLSMDLVTLSTLTTDTGKAIPPNQWDGASGGHHVAGILSFPINADGVSLLDGAKTLTLTIKGVDVPERVFTWQLTSP